MIEVGADLRELVGAAVTDWAVDRPVDAGYRVDALLGAGGMASAFLAHVEAPAGAAAERPGRPANGTRCVLKVLLPQVVLREAKVAELSFKKEVIALSRLAEKLPPSPFVVRYHDAGMLACKSREASARGVDPLLLPWCVLELVDGRPLGTTLDERLDNAAGPLEPERAAALIDGILRGVRAVHSVGLVHRDLKPSNVLVCGEPPNELPKITDFGVARAAGVGDTFDVTVGTTGYCALEQIEGPTTNKREIVGPWSDVFALGAIVYEILAREIMYDSPTAMGFVGLVLARKFERLATRNDLGEAWASTEGQALAAKWDEVLERATSPRSPGGGTLGNEARFSLRHRDVDELLDDVAPLLESMRALARRSRPSSALSISGSVARIDERELATSRWEWTISAPSPSPLSSAACRTDGAVLGACGGRLVFYDGQRWIDIDARKGDDANVAVLAGGAGTFVVVRRDGEVEVLPGGGSAFSFRLPFAVRAATAVTGHPLGVAWLVVQAQHGEWNVVRMQGRIGVPFARFGASSPIRAIARDARERLVVGGATLHRHGEEAFLATLDARGHATALPPPPGGSIHALAFDADGALVVAGASSIARIELDGARLVKDEPDDSMHARSIDALVALADGQVWGFAGGLVARRRANGAWSTLRAEASLSNAKLLAAASSGARVWAVHDDGRIMLGRLAVGRPA